MVSFPIFLNRRKKKKENKRTTSNESVEQNELEIYEYENFSLKNDIDYIQ